MTNANPIGARIASYRRLAGFEKAADLADAIANERITTSVIQNIESGRKSDISVTQLIEIAYAIGVSPVMLLAPMTSRRDRVDLPGASAPIREMSVDEFDGWVSMQTFAPGASGRGEWARAMLDTVLMLRSLDDVVKQWRSYDGKTIDPDGVRHRKNLTAYASGILWRLDRNENIQIDWLPDDLREAVTALREDEEAQYRREPNGPLLDDRAPRSDGDD